MDLLVLQLVGNLNMSSLDSPAVSDKKLALKVKQTVTALYLIEHLVPVNVLETKSLFS